MVNLTKGSAKSGGTDKRAEAAHRIVALLNATMILLNPVIEVLAGLGGCMLVGAVHAADWTLSVPDASFVAQNNQLTDILIVCHYSVEKPR